ncbi:unnamed protein product, partial [Owenia fusiformis]
EGFSGQYCENKTSTSLCEPNLCENNSTCQENENDFECECSEGFDGKLCELRISPCESSPCVGKAKCVETIDSIGHTCVCPSDHYGNDCTFCKPKDDCEGHFTCNVDNGEKVCIENWNGGNCNVWIGDPYTCLDPVNISHDLGGFWNGNMVCDKDG